ncbi:MAG: tRNA1(Val) (adenine(37)-N6)-methyltransferase [Clostridia bacterium]
MDEETLDDLQLDGLMLLQKKNGFRFGVDAVILADFAQVKKDDLVLDIGTGTGIIPVLLAAKSRAKQITGLEIQQEIAEMAVRSVKMNQLEGRVSILQGDIQEWASLFGKAHFHLVVCNPPYMELDTGMCNATETLSIARHEVTCTLEDIVKAAAGVLQPNGRIAMIHRPHRLVDLFTAFRAHGIEPKTLRFVCPNANAAPSMILVHGTKHGKKELRVRENLYIFDETGAYSAEINQIYGRKEAHE